MKGSFILMLFLIQTGLQAQNLEFWGLTSRGGIENGGTIFKTDASGDNHSIQFSFPKIDGQGPAPTALCNAGNGKFYGTTQLGGYFDTGVLFEYDYKTNTYTKKIDFNSETGCFAFSSPILATNGKLYGVTSAGGISSKGTLYEYDPVSGSYMVKVNFSSLSLSGHPKGALFQASNGMLYGFDEESGVIFEFDPVTGACEKKIMLNSSNPGAPGGSLIQASDGKLYGVTMPSSFSPDKGGIFEYDIALNKYTRRMNFSDSLGFDPSGPLMQANDGKLYGLTKGGGRFSRGVLFEFDPLTDQYLKKMDFDELSGYEENGSLMQASDGKLYGVLKRGGQNNAGVLFEYDLSVQQYKKRWDFVSYTESAEPIGALKQADNGKLYGVTARGGGGIYRFGGTIFEFDPVADIYTKKISLDHSSLSRNPFGSLVQADNGRFYGVTNPGWEFDTQQLFEFDPLTSLFAVKKIFADTVNGRYPLSSLCKADNGRLYGMTYLGGIHDAGVLFEYDPVTSTFTKKIDFDGISGAGPSGDLMQAKDGKLYGLTPYGATTGGVLFEYTLSSGLLKVKKSFADLEKDGTNPMGRLVQADNGKLYGITNNGGVDNGGVIFEYDPVTEQFTKKIDLTIATGSNPQNGLIKADNGKLYGMAFVGGSFDQGTLFEYNPSANLCEKKIDFDGATNGANPKGMLMLGSNGKLYGMADAGGTYNLGTFFEYNTDNGILIKKMDFNGRNGSSPKNGQLIEISGVNAVTENNLFKDVIIYPNPVSDLVNINFGDLRNIILQIHNASGQLIYYKENISKPNYQFKLIGAAGVYLVDVIVNKQKKEYKLIKK
jgi:uncharacterized repeat protein (TIGR03803 family)